MKTATIYGGAERRKFSDIEVMALSLTAECLSIDRENYLFSKLNTEYLETFENLISSRQYNDRRKLLFEKTEQAESLWQRGLTGRPMCLR